MIGMLFEILVGDLVVSDCIAGRDSDGCDRVITLLAAVDSCHGIE